MKMVTWGAWPTVVVVVGGCRPVPPTVPSESAPVAVDPTEAEEPVPTPDGPRYRTILERPCAIVSPRAIKCLSSNDGQRALEVWQALDEDFAAAEHFVHIDDTPDRVCALVQPSGRVLCWGGARSTLWKEQWFFPRWELEPVDRAVDFVLTDGSICSLDAAGAVACWGANEGGQLGDGTRTARGEPAVVDLPAAAVDIEAHGTTVCAALRTGVVHCWGGNETKGDPRRTRPEPIAGLARVRALESPGWARVDDDVWARWQGLDHVPGRGFTTAKIVSELTERYQHDHCWLDGTELWCDTGPEHAAERHLDEVVELDMGDEDACLRRADRSVWCRGHRIPLYHPPPSVAFDEPTRVPGLSGVVQVAATGTGVCALHDGGAVSCWGRGEHLVHPPSQSRGFIGVPRRVPLPGPADQIVVAEHGACARVGGLAHCWGSRGQVHELGPAVAVAVRASLPCADTGEALRCLHEWRRDEELPRLVRRPQSGSVVAWNHRCAVTRGRVQCEQIDDELRCLLDDASEEACRLREHESVALEGTLRVGGGDSMLVGGGGVCALRRSGTFDCASFRGGWLSFADYGIEPQRDVVAAAAGLRSICVIVRGGELRCWSAGERLDEPGRRRDPGIDDAVAVALGDGLGYAIRRDGTLWSWGGNDFGQRGLGGEGWSDSKIPVWMPLLDPTTEVPQRPNE